MKTKSIEVINWLQRGRLLAQLGQLEIALDCFEIAILLEDNQDQAKYEKYLIRKELDKEVKLIFV